MQYENTQADENRRYGTSGQTPWGRSCKTPDYGHGNHKGVEVHIRKVAPLGDPLEVTVRGYELSIRKADAELIEVE